MLSRNGWAMVWATEKLTSKKCLRIVQELGFLDIIVRHCLPNGHQEQGYETSIGQTPWWWQDVIDSPCIVTFFEETYMEKKNKFLNLFCSLRLWRWGVQIPKPKPQRDIRWHWSQNPEEALLRSNGHCCKYQIINYHQLLWTWSLYSLYHIPPKNLTST